MRNEAKILSTEKWEFEEPREDFAQEHADQWIGCVACGASHHNTSFCPKCGRCFYTQPVSNDEVGTFVYCECGEVSWWD